jgi:hypothetical protein
MPQLIIYPGDEGRLAIITPILDCGLPLEQIALKDVPAGKPFLVISDTDLPDDNEYRDAWEADFSEPHGYGLGHDAWTLLNNQ